MNKYQYKVQGVDYDVEIEDIDGNVAKVNVNGIPFEVEIKQPIKSAHVLHKPKVQAPAAPAASVPPVAPVQTQSVPAGSGIKVLAPLPGTIVDVKVNVGDTVKNGDIVVILEAMKMQNNIEAECAGTVTSVVVSKGDTVMEGAVLVTIG